MTSYVVRRLLLLIPALFLITVVAFLSTWFVPRNMLELMIAQMGMEPPPGAVQMLEHQLGRDQPIGLAYVRWLGVAPQANGKFAGVIEGNLGKSLWSNQSVTQQLQQRLPVSAELGLIALITALLTSLPLGAYSATRQGTPVDYLGRVLSIVFISLPAFWIAVMVMVYPHIWWGWAPSDKYVQLVKNVGGNLEQFILPGFIMGMAMGGSLLRMTRNMMVDTLHQDYIRTAWAKGLKERTVVVRHAVKNTVMPLVTMIGLMVPMVVGGVIIIEQVFGLPGIGLMLFNAFNMRDFPVISGVNLFLATVILLTHLVVDLTYAWLDPRVQYK